MIKSFHAVFSRPSLEHHWLDVLVTPVPFGHGTEAVIDGDDNDNTLNGTSDSDTISGYGGNDRLNGFDLEDTLYGGGGNDILTGHNGIDQLFGGSGDDALQGGGGNFTQLSTLQASDVIRGGTGNDTMTLDYGGFILVDTAQPAAIIVDITSGVGRVKVSGYKGENFESIERLIFFGPDGDDGVMGGSLDDTIDGAGGHDVLSGGGGDDFITDSWGSIEAYGGAGEDFFALNRSSTDSPDTQKVVVDGNSGTLTVGGADLGTFSGFETLQITGGHANDNLTGKTDGVNTLRGGLGNDELVGGDLDDTLNGGTGNDEIEGGAGNDLMTADGGVDAIQGQAGDDVIVVHLGSDIGASAFIGGGGTDSLRIDLGATADIDLTGVTIGGLEKIDDFNGVYHLIDYTITMTTSQFKQFDEFHLNTFDDDITIRFADNADVVMPSISKFLGLQLADGGQKVDFSACSFRPIIITGGNGNDTIIAVDGSSFFTCSLGEGNDRFIGGTSFDRPTGGGGNDKLTGNASNDTLTGNAGKDRLDAGDGDDTLNGGTEADKIDSGTGLDKFVYAAGAGDSTGTGFDTISGADFNAADKFDLTIAITGIDSIVNGGTLSKATFNDDLEDAIGNGELGVAHAVLFNSDDGDFEGKTFLIVNVNGQAGYEAGADLVILLDGSVNLAHLDTTDFF
jgi:Ca2+-binding RTX toxin-like protein